MLSTVFVVSWRIKAATLRLPTPRCKPERIERYQKGLPDWLTEQLNQYYQIRRANWRAVAGPGCFHLFLA